MVSETLTPQDHTFTIVPVQILVPCLSQIFLFTLNLQPSHFFKGRYYHVLNTIQGLSLFLYFASEVDGGEVLGVVLCGLPIDLTWFEAFTTRSDYSTLPFDESCTQIDFLIFGEILACFPPLKIGLEPFPTGGQAIPGGHACIKAG